jgi:murein DD-endopeptidase MepM/ murein hydrolase activator NlpD
MRARAAVLCLLAGLVATQLGAARAQSPATLQHRIATGSATAQALRQAIASDDQRIAAVQGSIAQVQQRLAAAQAAAAREQARLASLQDQLRAARAYLVRLQERLRTADAALRANLIAQYEDGQPDLVAVVLNSHGFADLLERGTFYRRIQEQDARIVHDDKLARTRVIAQATTLGRLEVAAQRQTTAMLAQRDQIDTLQLALLRRRGNLVTARGVKAAKLSRAQAQVASLRSDLARLEAQQAQLSAPPAAAPGHEPILSGGGFVFPMPAGAAVGPGSWTPDQGVDIAAPGHTPLLAVASGTVVLHGIGGFGDWAPVLHLDDGRYVYYGHAGPGNAVAIGTHVAAGQVIGEVGAGIVGISSGPHLEIGFCDGSGTPLGPQTAGTMMGLLRAAYGA